MKRIIILFGLALFLAATSASAKDANGTLTVQGKCNMCKTKIEKAAKSVEGVKTARWDSESKALRLSYDTNKVKLEAISKAVAAAGYDTDRDKAEATVYDVLPACCKYR
jgi:Cu(I)/Ag(I) efflux system membrane fusion protein